MLMKSLLSFEKTFLMCGLLLELRSENVARKRWGGGVKRSNRKGGGGGGGKCDIQKCIDFQCLGRGCKRLIVVEGVNATIPSLSLKYSHDHAYVFLGRYRHP